jgi:hypothetical protein
MVALLVCVEFTRERKTPQIGTGNNKSRKLAGERTTFLSFRLVLVGLIFKKVLHRISTLTGRSQQHEFK